jgi:hypothetical protein
MSWGFRIKSVNSTAEQNSSGDMLACCLHEIKGTYHEAWLCQLLIAAGLHSSRLVKELEKWWVCRWGHWWRDTEARMVINVDGLQAMRQSQILRSFAASTFFPTKSICTTPQNLKFCTSVFVLRRPLSCKQSSWGLSTTAHENSRMSTSSTEVLIHFWLSLILSLCMAQRKV